MGTGSTGRGEMLLPEERERIRARLIERAHADPEIAGAAAVGSSASGGDRWSDLDLTFAVAEHATVERVMNRWTRFMEDEFQAANLFDLTIPGTVYRVFLCPGALQVDLSFSRREFFGPRGPRFDLIFGEPVELPQTRHTASPEETFGLGVHHAVRARVCIERRLVWQAEYWIHQLRDYALTLASLRHGVEAGYGRGFDRLPEGVSAPYQDALVRSLAEAELRRALAVAVRGLLREGDGFVAVTDRVRPLLAEIAAEEKLT